MPELPRVTPKERRRQVAARRQRPWSLTRDDDRRFRRRRSRHEPDASLVASRDFTLAQYYVPGRTRIRITMSYESPFGIPGRFLDRLFMRRAMTPTVQVIVGGLKQVYETETSANPLVEADSNFKARFLRV